MLEVILALNAVLVSRSNPFLVEPHQNALAEQYAVVVLLESHVVKPPCVHWKDLPVGLDLQFQLSSHIKPDGIQEPVQPLLTAVQYHYVIHIPVVVPNSQLLFQPVIHIGQVQVGQILAREVSDWQAFILAVAVNNSVQQPQHLGIGNGVADYLFERSVIYIVVELADVNFQTVPCPLPVQHHCSVYVLHQLVDSTPLYTGIGVLNEDVLPVLSQNINHNVVNDSVWKERSYEQRPLFRVVDYPNRVLTRNIGLVVQDFPQPLQPFRDIVVEITDLPPVPFAFLSVVLCPCQRLAVIYQVIKVAELLSLATFQLASPLHIEPSWLSVGVIYELAPVGIAPPNLLFPDVIVPLAQIRVFKLLTHTDSTFSFFYQLPAYR